MTRAAQLAAHVGETVHPEDVAGIIGSGRSFIYKALRAQALSFSRVGREYRIPRDEAIRFIESCGIPVRSTRD